MKADQLDNPAAFMQAVTAGKQVLAENAVTGQGLPALGTQVLMNVINEVGAMPTRNMREVQFEGASNISGEAMLEPREGDGKPNLVTNAACFGCTIACGRISTIDQGHFTVQNKPQYWGASGGLEYEAAWALGSDTGIDDLNTHLRQLPVQRRRHRPDFVWCNGGRGHGDVPGRQHHHRAHWRYGTQIRLR